MTDDPNPFEPGWMRDKRLRDEEARMVRVEDDIKATRTSSEATHELLLEERKARRAAEEALAKHEQDDAAKFSSIDSRLQGTQTQLSTIIQTLERLEHTVSTGAADHEGRIKVLEDDSLGRNAIEKFLRNAWVQVGIGAGIGSSLMGIYMALS